MTGGEKTSWYVYGAFGKGNRTRPNMAASNDFCPHINPLLAVYYLALRIDCRALAQNIMLSQKDLARDSLFSL